jgi:hypothetical protein
MKNSDKIFEIQELIKVYSENSIPIFAFSQNVEDELNSTNKQLIGSFETNYTSPNSLDFSLSYKIIFIVVSLIFVGKSNTKLGNYGKFFFLQLKWNF